MIKALIAALLTTLLIAQPIQAKTYEWWTEEDINLMTAIVAAEARGECFDGMVAVANVIINRLKDGRWGNTIADVVFSPNQFARPFRYEQSRNDCERANWMRCKDAVLAALGGERVVSENVLFFQRQKRDYWFGARHYLTIGAHNFFAVEGD